MRGRDKLLEIVDGQPLLSLMASRALSVCDHVFVTLPIGNPDRADALSELDITIVEVPNASDGISASIHAGVKATKDCDALMVLPADLPELTEVELAKTWKCFEKHNSEQIVRGATEDGSAGHPVVFPKKHFNTLNGLQGDSGANKLIQSAGFVICQLGENRALTDLDTPEDWSNWRSSRS